MPTKSLRVAVLCLFALPLLAAATEENHPPIHVNHPALKSLSWQLAAEGATFRGYSTFDMIDLLHSLDCHHIELAPGQSLSADHAGVVVGHDMPTADVDALLAKLKSVKMDIVSYGPVQLKDDETARAVFEFAKKLKAKNVVISQSAVTMESLDGIASQAKVKAALLLPGAVGSAKEKGGLQGAFDNRSPNVGACVEIDGSADGAPMSDAIKQLGNRLIEVQLTHVGPKIAPVLQQLKDQGFKGVCAVKHDDAGTRDEAVDGFIASVNAFSDILAKIAGAH